MSKTVIALVIFILANHQWAYAGTYTKSCRPEVMSMDISLLATEFAGPEQGELPILEFELQKIQTNGASTSERKIHVFTFASIIREGGKRIKNASFILLVNQEDCSPYDGVLVI